MVKILIPYKDWLIHTRSEVRPEVGGKIKVSKNTKGGMINRTVKGHLCIKSSIDITLQKIDTIYV